MSDYIPKQGDKMIFIKKFLPPENEKIKAGHVRLRPSAEDVTYEAREEDVEHYMEHEEPSTACSITVGHEPADIGS
ncbi:unnamed protein product [Rotaria sordida]|uniref:Uncharacterized protein n=1 Tax=Rotaria sordida TaxID=392033 RepID=A0A816CXE1_9BILA|nr:unnamed protein product [Rotaria sordida]CAF1629846.1 unnamed protein product [Rotaria sordida]